MKIQSIRGTHDVLPGAVELWQRVEGAAGRIFRLYGYAEIRTPILEETELFARSIGAETDIVRKEMYTLEDARGKSVTLRPEGTASVVRAFIEHGLHTAGHPVKLYYLGPMFRRERPQKGRYRQFHQIGGEVLGSDHPAVEAEVLEMLQRFLRELELADFEVLVNSVGCPACRPAYVELLRKELRKKADSLCPECRRRTETNPMRVLDCKVPECQPAIDDLPRLPDHLCLDCREHFGRFLELLERQGIDRRLEPRLVRGLDYYVRTTFEIVSGRLGPTQNAIIGGGRYDGLSELLGGPAAKGFGFALGLERLVLLLSGRDDLRTPYRAPAPDVFLAWMGSASLEESLALARDLRSRRVFAYLDFEGRSLKAQMRQANRLGARYACVVGEDEIQSGVFTLKRMSDGSETRLERRALAEQLVRVRGETGGDEQIDE